MYKIIVEKEKKKKTVEALAEFIQVYSAVRASDEHTMNGIITCICHTKQTKFMCRLHFII